MSTLQPQQQGGQQPAAAVAADAVLPAEAIPAQGQPLQQAPQQQAQQVKEKPDKKKKVQPGDERPPGKCHFFLHNKRRHCKFDAVAGKQALQSSGQPAQLCYGMPPAPRRATSA